MDKTVEIRGKLLVLKEIHQRIEKLRITVALTETEIRSEIDRISEPV